MLIKGNWCLQLVCRIVMSEKGGIIKKGKIIIYELCDKIIFEYSIWFYDIH